MVIKIPVYFLIISLNILKADCWQNNAKKPYFFQFFKKLSLFLQLLLLQTFHIYNHFIFLVFFNVRLVIFLFVDAWRRDFNFLGDTWMGPTTCSVFLLRHLAEGAAGTQPQPVWQTGCLLFSWWEPPCHVPGPTSAPYLHSQSSLL